MEGAAGANDDPEPQLFKKRRKQLTPVRIDPIASGTVEASGKHQQPKDKDQLANGSDRNPQVQAVVVPEKVAIRSPLQDIPDPAPHQRTVPTHVFNHDAYCELCRKEFCNKYFLKTHKANKHGIVPAPVAIATGQFQPVHVPVVVPNNSAVDEELEEAPLNLIVNAVNAPPSDSVACDDLENLEKLKTMLRRLRPSLSLPSSETSDLEDKLGSSDGEEDREEVLGTATGRRNNGAKPTSSFCEICNKELCNKYFMRTHMQRMHGIELDHGAHIGGVVCNICNKELCSKYFLRVHKQNTHGIGGAVGFIGQPDSKSASLTCVVCGKRFRSGKWLAAHVAAEHSSADPSEDPSPVGMGVISRLLWGRDPGASRTFSCSQCTFTTPVLAFLFVHERAHQIQQPSTAEINFTEPSPALRDLVHDKTWWHHQIPTSTSTMDLSTRPSS